MSLIRAQWHSPACFDPIIARLLEIGYSCATVSLPSVGPSAHALADPNADSAAVRSVIVEQLEFKKDVVLVAHSYAGIPTNNAIEGLVKQRDATFGVIGIVYLAVSTVALSFVLVRSENRPCRLGLPCQPGSDACCHACSCGRARSGTVHRGSGEIDDLSNERALKRAR